MLLFAFILLVFLLALYFIPVARLRRNKLARAQDYCVSSEPTPPVSIQNASIAYALRMASFGAFFAMGARGDFWPAFAAAASFGLGVCLIYALRRPLLAFWRQALSEDGSVTPHAMIARQHGGDPRVRLLAAASSVFVLACLIAAEALGITIVLKAIFPGGAGAATLLSVALLVLSGLYATLAGNSGAMRSAQAQLGMIYFGLFGAAALVLYLLVSALRPMPPHVTLAIALFAILCTVILAYRRSKYVDAGPFGADQPAQPGAPADPPRAVLAFRRFHKILNVLISIPLVLVIVLAAMTFLAKGFDTVIQDAAAALRGGLQTPDIGLLALLLVPFFQPLVDVTNWQRIAALEKDFVPAGTGPDRAAKSPEQRSALRKMLVTYAAESSLVTLSMCLIGAIGAAATAGSGMSAGEDAMAAFVAGLAGQQNFVAAGAVVLLLIAFVFLALSTAIALFSASLCTIRYDILPALWPDLAAGRHDEGREAVARKRARGAGALLCLAVIAMLLAAGAFSPISFASREFLALLFALSCPQLAFAPLVLGPVLGGHRAGVGTVTAGWALAILGVGAAVGLSAVAAYVGTGNESWLWAAAPACLGSGFLLFAIAGFRPAPAPPPTA